METVGDEAKTVGPDAVHQLDERETLHTHTHRQTDMPDTYNDNTETVGPETLQKQNTRVC